MPIAVSNEGGEHHRLLVISKILFFCKDAFYFCCQSANSLTAVIIHPVELTVPTVVIDRVEGVIALIELRI